MPKCLSLHPSPFIAPKLARQRWRHSSRRRHPLSFQCNSSKVFPHLSQFRFQLDTSYRIAVRCYSLSILSQPATPCAILTHFEISNLFHSRFHSRSFLMRRLSSVLLILFCLAATSAAPHPDDPSKKFVGAWRLVSIEGIPPGRPFVYDHATGLIMYDASGHMCVNIVFKADRKPYAPYFGTFTIDAKAGTVTHHLENNLIPGRQSTDNVRWFDFQGPDRLLLTPIEDAKDHLLWERLK